MGSKRVVGGDAVSVVSLSLTEEIALYTSDVKAVEYNASRARTNAHGIDSWPAAKPNSGTGRRNTATAANTNNANSNSNSNGGAGAFAWNIPDWTCPATTGKTRGSQAGLPRLPERSPAPALMITDLFSKISTFPQPDEESPNSAPMQRVESGSLDPTLSPQPAYSPTLLTPISKGASDGHSSPHQHRHSSALPSSSTLHWSQPQWNTASPFRPDAPAHPSDPSRRPSFATTSYHDAEDQSPTAPNFPPASPQAAVVHSAAAADADVDAAAEKRRATTYYDASWLPAVQEVPSSPTTELPIAIRVLQPTSPSLRSPLSPKSPKSLRSFGHSETPYELRRSQRRTSYSLPRPPPGYEPASSPTTTTTTTTTTAAAAGEFDFDDDHAPTPRLDGMEFGESSASPLSSNFEPETPNNVAATFPELHVDRERKVKGEQEEEEERGEDDLRAQFCSVLLLDLGDGRAIPLSPSPGDEPRPDPFSLLAC